MDEDILSQELWRVKNPQNYDMVIPYNSSINNNPYLFPALKVRMIPKGLAEWFAERIIDEIIRKDYGIERILDPVLRADIRATILLGSAESIVEEESKQEKFVKKLEELEEVAGKIEQQNFSNMTYAQLRSLAKTRGINANGTKEELIQKLKG